MSADSGNITVLILLDLSAAFDTVDHTILLNRLKNMVGIDGTAFNWFSSYLSDRVFRVTVDNFSSSTAVMSCGVPQGSVLGPILFSLYMLPLGHIIRHFTPVSYHCYADDSQLYVSLRPENHSKLDSLHSCLTAIKDWMASNFLQLNTDKTEVLVIGPDHISSSISPHLGPLTVNTTQSARNLGVIFDQQLNFNQHIKSLVQSCYIQIRNIAKVKPMLPRNILEQLIHTLIFSRLDYCNSLFTCLNDAAINRLQLVQNTAARLLTNTRRSEHITPVLATLHWLPVHYRIRFKILLITYKSLHGLAPLYISELLTPYVASRSLRSENQMLLAVPRSKLRTKGDRAFSVLAPLLWNKLPLGIRSAESVHHFKKLLKTHMYRLAFV